MGKHDGTTIVFEAGSENLPDPLVYDEKALRDGTAIMVGEEVIILGNIVGWDPMVKKYRQGKQGILRPYDPKRDKGRKIFMCPVFEARRGNGKT